MFSNILQSGDIAHIQKKHGKSHFSLDEDKNLVQLVQIFGENNWSVIAGHMPNRSTRQCRERYIGYLCPSIKNGPWTDDEDKLLIKKYNEYGPKWTFLSSFFKGRSDQNIKNRFHKHLKKYLNNTFENDNYKSAVANESVLLSSLEFSDIFTEPELPNPVMNSTYFNVDDMDCISFLL